MKSTTYKKEVTMETKDLIVETTNQRDAAKDPEAKIMSGTDDSSLDSEQTGFNEDYESLSDHEVAEIINPFRTTKQKQRSGSRPLVETVSSPSGTPTQISPLVLSSSSPSLSVDPRRSSFSPFDPMAPEISKETSSVKKSNAIFVKRRPLNSLLDESLEQTTTFASKLEKTAGNKSVQTAAQNASSTFPRYAASASTTSSDDVRMAQYATTYGGAAGYLEMEEEPIRFRHSEAERVLEEQEDLIDFTPAEDPIQTSSGLLLTHRRTSVENRAHRQSANSHHHHHHHNNNMRSSNYPASYRPRATRFEVESSPWGVIGLGGGGGGDRDGYGDGYGRSSSTLLQARRMLSFAKLWVLFFCVVLVLGTGIMFHAFRHEDSNGSVAAAASSTQQKSNQNQNAMLDEGQQKIPQQILLLPLHNAAELARQQREIEQAQRNIQQRPGSRRLLSHLSGLRSEFEEWIIEHKKAYRSEHEKERRFSIWKNNHFRTIEKNKKHGNCPLMNKPVFGSNHLKDLTPEEFQTQFLTGYNGPNADGHEIKTGRRRRLNTAHSPPLMHHVEDVTRHPSIHGRILQQWQMSGFSTSSCKWYDISCWVRILFEQYLYLGVGTMEPKYDSNTYPKSFDWRDLGAVTDVRRQGDCGACWAITAVETVESAYFIATGSLVKLAESEVISCTDTCNMCYGGWPQDAYDYVMDHKGIMLANEWAYDGSTLLAVSQEIQKSDSELDEELFASYINGVCPASQGSGSGDNNGNDGQTRYGNIKGYGFATDRCICYSDGSGCDCDNQNEGVAVRNVASYGPATVCLDASTWQDYSGGIITAYSGCSQKFLAMNHCVQVVGYAYNDGSSGGDGGEEDAENGNSGDSHDNNSHDSGSGSQDSSRRVGYWIVRNQWSSNWGMNGYAYVSMGENTCGILNDMTQAYF